jgi:hypothetical protein
LLEVGRRTHCKQKMTVRLRQPAYEFSEKISAPLCTLVSHVPPFGRT